jgi:hypothetical protein
MSESSPEWLLDILIKEKLLPNQFFLLRFLLHDNNNEGVPSLTSKYSYYMKELGYETLQAEHIEDLVKRGYLINLNREGSDFSAKKLKVTDKFRDCIIPNSTNFDEYVQMYPGFVKSGNNSLFLKNVDLDELKIVYNNVIKSIKEHRDMISLLEYGIRNDMVMVKIDAFLKNKVWLEIKKDKEKGLREVQQKMI